MELTQEIIDKINSKSDSYEQGIYKEPYGIPVHIKDYVLYNRYSTGGYSGGNCWNDDRPTYYRNDDDNEFKILDIFLEEFCPNISYLQYRKVKELIHTNNEREYEYYGNSTDWEIQYIIISELFDLLETFKN